MPGCAIFALHSSELPTFDPCNALRTWPLIANGLPPTGSTGCTAKRPILRDFAGHWVAPDRYVNSQSRSHVLPDQPLGRYRLNCWSRTKLFFGERRAETKQEGSQDQWRLPPPAPEGFLPRHSFLHRFDPQAHTALVSGRCEHLCDEKFPAYSPSARSYPTPSRKAVVFGGRPDGAGARRNVRRGMGAENRASVKTRTSTNLAFPPKALAPSKFPIPEPFAHHPARYHPHLLLNRETTQVVAASRFVDIPL